VDNKYRQSHLDIPKSIAEIIQQQEIYGNAGIMGLEQ
jgi:hypothetical protein